MKNLRPFTSMLRPRFATNLGFALAFAGALSLSPFAVRDGSAATITHSADTTDALNVGASWNGGLVPGSPDTASWGSGSAGGSFLLGSSLTWHGLQILSPSGAVTIGSDGNTLSLGTGGIDMSLATQNLTISSNLTVRVGAQTWNVAGGQALALNTGTFTRTAGAILTVTGAGTVSTSMSGLNSLTNGLLGAWANVKSAGAAANDAAGGYTFATLSGSNIVPYTGATSETLTTSYGGIPSGGNGTVNYDFNPGGTLSTTGLLRNINTLRYTGPGAIQNAGAPVLLMTNAVMNSGSGTLTMNVNTNPGANADMILAAESAPIIYGGAISVSGTGGTGVTVTGTSLVTFTAVNTYTGPTTVSGGNLLISGAGSINNTSGVNIVGAAAAFIENSTVSGTVPITVTSGTLGGTGTVGAVTTGNSSSAVIANVPGSTFTLGSLTFGGASAVNASVGGSVPIRVNGALATTSSNGLVTISGSGTWTTGLNNIISFSSFSGSINDFTMGTVLGLNGRESAGGLQLSGTNIAVSIVGDIPVWTGTATGGLWTTAATGSTASATPSWALLTANTPTDFWAGDLVQFNDTANVNGATVIPSTTVTISGSSPNPASIAFNNNVLNYTVKSSGAFGITGPGTLTVNGSGSVTLSESNSYTGATTVNAGTLNLSSTGSLSGTPIHVGPAGTFNEDATSTIAGSASLSSSGTVTLSGSNSYTGATTVTGGLTTIAGSLPGTAPIAVTSGTLALTGAINPNSTAGAPTLTIGNTAGNNGVMVINGGLLNATLATAFTPSVLVGGAASANGSLVLNSGTFNTSSELWLSGIAGGYGSFTMNGGVANIGSWLAVSRSGGNGVLRVTGGVLNVTTNNLTLGSVAAGTNQNGVASFTGGTTDVTNGGIYVGEIVPGVLDIAGTASVTASGALGVHLANTATSSNGILNLNGGTLTTPIVSMGPGTSGIVNFNGGTLVSSSSTATFMQGLTDAYVFGNGGTINNGGNTITIPQALLAPTGEGINLSASNGSTLAISGTGFIGAPLVTITGGGGTGATALALLGSSGSLSLIITNPGVGYTSAPTFNFFGGGGTVLQSGAAALVNNISGGITLTGSGVTTLSGANTYTGVTSVAQGTLALVGSLANTSGVTINSGAILRAPGFYSIAGTLNSMGTVDMTDTAAETLTVGNVTFNNSILNLDLLNSSSDAIAVSGAATVTGSNVINIDLPAGQSVNPGTYVLISSANGGLGSGFTLGTLPSNSFSFSLGTSTANQEILTISGSAVPATAYWTGLASASGANANNNWGFGLPAKSNWSTTPDGLTDPFQAPGAVSNVIMTASNAVGVSGTLSTQLDRGYSIKSLTFNVPASTALNNVLIDTNGNILLIGTGGLAMASTSTASGEILDTTGTGAVLMNGSENWANNSNTQSLTVADNMGPSVSGTSTFTVNGTGSGGVVLAGAIGNGSAGGTLALVLNQAGITQLNGANTFTGGITLMSGIIQLGNLSAFNSAGANSLTFSAGSTADLQLNGLGSGGGVVTVTSLNTNAVVGTPVIESGTTPGVIDTFTVNNATANTYAGVLRDGSGGTLIFAKAGAGLLTLTASNSYSGGTDITGGAIAINSAANLGSLTIPSNITMISGTLESTGNSYDLGSNRSIDLAASQNTLQVDSGTLTVSGTIYDTGGLTKSGAGTLLLTGSNSYTGPTNVSAGPLVVVTALSSTTTAIGATGILQLQANSGNTAAGVSSVLAPQTLGATGVAGASGFAVGGTIQLRADNSVASGGVVIFNNTAAPLGVVSPGTKVESLNFDVNQLTAAGSNLTLQFGAAGSAIQMGTLATGDTINVTGGNGYTLSLGTINVGNNSSVTFNPTTANLIIAGISNGSTGAIAKTGAGTMTLNGVSTSSGALTVAAGNLIVTGSISAASSVGISGGNLEADGIVNLSAVNTLSGAGQLSGIGSVGPITANGGTLAPGLTLANATSAPGVLSASGAVTLSSTTAFSIRLGVASPTDSDSLQMNSGNVNLAGANLMLTLGGAYVTQAIGTDYVIINGTPAGSTISSQFAQGTTITASNGNVFTILYGVNANDTGAGNDVLLQLQSIPEPGTWAMLLGGLGILALRHRARRRRTVLE